MAYALPNPTSPNTSDALTSAPVRANFQSIQAYLNAFDGAGVLTKSIQEAALADAVNPRLRATNSGQSYVVSGLTISFGALVATITAGVAYVNGYYVNSLGGTVTCAINSDVYIDISNVGTITPVTVANNALVGMALTANSLRLGLSVTNGTAIVAVYQGAPAAAVAPKTLPWYGADPIGNIAYPLGASSAKSLVNPYKFRVYRNSAWTVGATAKVAFDTKNFDTSSNFDVVTNNRFTAPISGFYQFNTNVGAHLTTGNIGIVRLYKNGTPCTLGNSNLTGTTFDLSQNTCDLLQLVAGDYIEVFYTGTVGNAGLTGTDATNFSGFLVSVS